MPAFNRVWVLLVFSVALQHVHADTSLWIPGFDPQPLSVAILGSDAKSHTTWEIVPGSLTGTFSQPSFFGTAVMVQGPDDVHVTWQGDGQLAGQSFEITCTVAGNVADCTAPSGYYTTPYVFPQTVQPFVVQGGQTASPAMSAAPAPVQTSPGTTPSPQASYILPSATSTPSASNASSTGSASSSSAFSSPSPPPSSTGASQIIGTTPSPSASLISTNAASSPSAQPALAFTFLVLGLIAVL